MANSVLYGITERVLQKLGSLALQKDALVDNGIEAKLRKLQYALASIKGVLLDAEEKQGDNYKLRAWLDQLKDVLYDVEDLLDDVQCEALRKKLNVQQQKLGKVRHFFSCSNLFTFHLKMDKKISEIGGRLKQMVGEIEGFGLSKRARDGSVVGVRVREMKPNLVRGFDPIIGRDADKDKIIELLMQQDLPGDGANLSVIPIVGIGGLGKTALANLVFNDKRVREHFTLTIWVSMPGSFNVRLIVERIIQSKLGQSSNNLDYPQLHTLLRGVVSRCKLLLVLDDVRKMNWAGWDHLRSQLAEAANGTKVIVTTRDAKVPIITSSPLAYNLQGLTHEDSMSLFKAWAFDQNKWERSPRLLQIGDEIVGRCRGVPLALKMLGGLLYSKDDEGFWELVRDDDMCRSIQTEEDVLCILKLCYFYLPSHLKQCFALCSVFRRGRIIIDLEMAHFWTACGLIPPSIENGTPEDVSNKYLKELWSRSFFQEAWQSGPSLSFKMHDLLYDLAFSVSTEQIDCSMLIRSSQRIPERTRHVSFLQTDSSGQLKENEALPFLSRLKSNRVRMINCESQDTFISRDVDSMSKCEYLRSMRLYFTSFEELPSSIGKLKHLIELNLGVNCRMKKLPDAICKLHSLLFLSVSGCSGLEELPQDMDRMINLRYLTLTTKQKSLLESGIHRMKSLGYLLIRNCRNLKVLFGGTVHLNNLLYLTIENCPRLGSLPLGELTALESLRLVGCDKLMLTRLEDNESDLIPKLRFFTVSASPRLVHLPWWLLASADTLEELCIIDCINLTALPVWLQDLKHLKKLHIFGCPRLSSMQGVDLLSALQELHIAGCPELSKKCQVEDGELWPVVSHVPFIKDDWKVIQSNDH
ncbi:disease resistance protein RGA2-like [Syzygium oleosum]|uniref:disease resistance protein RGA2-like n=1 Tax=Syzygium oleosum TaxID=219896 RepID=UPI0024BBB075|nr:disease resistance protein RGA2-like [Syzygium oleosum]XP_056171399.1 disease resistance protein RGA2-like [Syzygium oleosum]